MPSPTNSLTTSCFHSTLDYKEEQTNELEALQSIYPDEYEEISTDPGEFSILIVPDEQDGDDTCKCHYTLAIYERLGLYRIFFASSHATVL